MIKNNLSVLVISRDSWNDTNNSGNTLSSLFRNWDSNNIANLYCRDEIPNNSVCKKYFKISESTLVKSYFGKTSDSNNFELKNDAKKEKHIYDFFRKNRFVFFLWIRELLWLIINWKTKELDNFIKEVSPDIIFTTSYDSFYTHRLVYYVKKKTDAKLVLFHCDDLVTFRQHSYSPFYWINRFILRLYMNKTIKKSELDYCITDEQARVYSAIYNKPFKVLYKTGSFEQMPKAKKQCCPIKIIYTGNIIYGRIQTLIHFANALKVINETEVKIVLDIYTANDIEEKHKQKLLNSKSVFIKGKVAYEDIPLILSEGDILLHVESFDNHQKKATALSFSTKLVDYLEAGRPILAIGWSQAASIKYIKNNNLGYVIYKRQEILKIVNQIIMNKKELNEVGENVWLFAKKNHNKDIVLQNFVNDLQSIISL